MAIKDWVSRFATGLGIDTKIAGGMETLVNTLDATRVAQAHALRDSLIAMQEQLATQGILGAPWFTWDPGSSLASQFDTASPVVGSDITGHTIQQVTYANLEWVEITATSSAGGTFFDSGVVLPILASPPTAHYMVQAEFLSIAQSGSEIGAGVLARFNGTTSAYLVRVIDQGAASQELTRWDANVKVNLGPNMSDPSINGVRQGLTQAIAARGAGTEVLVQMIIGEKLNYADVSGNRITAAGSGAIASSTNGTAGTVTNYFRNIRALSFLD